MKANGFGVLGIFLGWPDSPQEADAFAHQILADLAREHRLLMLIDSVLDAFGIYLALRFVDALAESLQPHPVEAILFGRGEVAIDDRPAEIDRSRVNETLDDMILIDQHFELPP